jgi:hypothetical protein
MEQYTIKMKNQYKITAIVLLSFVIISLFIFYINAEDVPISQDGYTYNGDKLTVDKDIKDITEFVAGEKKDDLKIQAKQISAVKTEVGDRTKVGLLGPTSELDINGKKITGVKAPTEGEKAEVTLDNKGEVTSADFKIDDSLEKGSDISIGDKKFNVPKGGRVLISEQDKSLIQVRVPKGSKIEKDPETINDSSGGGDVRTIKYISIDGDSTLPNGRNFKGILNNDGKTYFLNKGNEVIIDNVHLRNIDGLAKNVNPKMNIYFQEGNFEGNYVYFGEKTFKTGSLNTMDGNPALFLPGNPYLEVSKNSHLAIIPFANSEMILENGKLSHIGSGIVDNDYSSYLLSESKEKLFYKKGISIPGFDKKEFSEKLQVPMEYIPYKKDGTTLSQNKVKLVLDGKTGSKIISMDKTDDIGRLRNNLAPVDSKGVSPSSENINTGTGTGTTSGNLDTKEFNSQRNTKYTGTKGDVLSHDKKPIQMYEIGPDGKVKTITEETTDSMTATHEGEHGANRDLSRPYDRQGYSGYYIGNNKAVYVKNPDGVKLEDLANYVPQSLRGDRFQKYIQQYQPEIANIPKDPNVKYSKITNPLYMLDELWAYNLGAKSAIEENYHKADIAGLGEFSGFTLAMGSAIKTQNSQYWESSQGQQLQGFMKTSLEETMKTYNTAVSKGFSIESADANAINNLRTGADTDKLRDFAIKTFGSDWTKKVLGF